MTDLLQDPGVQGLAQLGRNAIERVAQLEAELAGYVEANRHMKGELDDALEDARKYCEAQREIARLREAFTPLADALLRLLDATEGFAVDAYAKATSRTALARAGVEL